MHRLSSVVYCQIDSFILIGVVGAMIGGFLLNYNTINLFNLQNAFNLTALLASLIGAVVLLTIVRLVRHGSSSA